MEIMVTILKYGFIGVLTVEALLVGRALVRMALERARAAAPAPAAAEE